jgi:hypothetical protein
MRQEAGDSPTARNEGHLLVNGEGSRIIATVRAIPSPSSASR